MRVELDGEKLAGVDGDWRTARRSQVSVSKHEKQETSSFLWVVLRTTEW
jgi:hypothetical protein